MHAEIQIDGSTIMFADATEQYKTRPVVLFIYVENADVTYEKVIAAGAPPLQNYLTRIMEEPAA